MVDGGGIALDLAHRPAAALCDGVVGGRAGYVDFRALLEGQRLVFVIFS